MRRAQLISATASPSLGALGGGEASMPTLEGLFRDHVTDVHRFVRRQLGPGGEEAEVEDLTQRVFILAGQGLPKFRGDCKASTWLYRISSRVVLRHLQSRRQHRLLLERIESQALQKAPSTDVEERALQQEKLRLVYRCLLNIKPKKRIVFLLHRVEGRSGAEIADILQIPEATVWSRLHHAKQELARQLETLRQKGDWDD